MPKNKYNYENATEKRAAQKEYGRLDLPYDDPSNHPEHLNQHEHFQILQREALNGNTKKVNEMLRDLPNHQKKDTLEMIKRSLEEVNRPMEYKYSEDYSNVTVDLN